VVVRLSIAEARMLAIGDLPMGFLGWWLRIVAKVVDEFHMMVVVGIEGVGFGNVAEVGG
jgi:hypothetical protein